MKSIFFLLSLLILSNAFAGQGGNGGDVVVCYDKTGAIIKIESYDFWNASKKFSLNVEVDNKTPYMEQIKRSMGRLAKIDPGLAGILIKEAEIFSPENIEKGLVGLVPGIRNNGDGHQSIIPDEDADTGCDKQEILRMAEFNLNPLPFEKPFKLTNYLWKKANEGTRFAIVQHEILYKHFITKLDEKDSVKAQLFNAYLASNEFELVTPVSYVDFIVRLKLERVSNFSVTLIPGMNFFVSTLNYEKFKRGIFSGELTTPYEFKLQDKILKANILEINSELQVLSARVIDPVELKLINGETQAVHEQLTWNSEGLITSGKFPRWVSTQIESNVFKAFGPFEFNKDGTPVELYLAVCSNFRHKGERFRVGKGGEYFAYFDKDGRLRLSLWFDGDKNKCDE